MAWSVDRLGRSLQDLIGFLWEIHALRIELYLHQQGLDSTTPAGKAMFQMMGVFSEFERAMIQERVRAGLRRAKAEGQRLGAYRATCPSERELGNRATFRLCQLIADGGVELERIACSCRPGTEGTPACNHARLSGVLRVRGEDVATIMVREGLARPYVCGRSSCPSHEGWCER